MSVQYKIPDHVHISQDCRQLLSRIFVPNPMKRITMSEIRKHPWFLKNLPRELTETAQSVYYKRDNTAPIYSLQSIEDIMKIVKEARLLPSSTPPLGFAWGGEDEEDEANDDKPEEEEEEEEEDQEEEEEEDEYEKHVKEVHASGEYQLT